MMKRILLTLGLCLSLAGSAWGASGTWTAADYATNLNWSNASNWSGASAPGTGEVATFDGSEGANGLPGGVDNEPSAGTIDIVFGSSYAATAINANLFNNKGAAIGDITFNNGGSARVDANFGTATVNTGGTMYIPGSTTVVGDVVLNGGKLDEAGTSNSILDGNVTATAASTVDWGAGDLVVNGGFDAGGNTITYVATTGAVLTCDQTSGLDLGTDPAPGLAVVIDCGADTVTLDDDISCYSFTMTGGTFDGAAKTITLNGGDALYTAGTVNNEPNVVFAASGNASWSTTAANRMGDLTIDSGVTVTQNGTVFCSGLLDGTGAGTLTGAANALNVIMLSASDWTFSGTITGTGQLRIIPNSASLAFTNELDAGTRPIAVGRQSVSGTTTFSGGVTCGDMLVVSTSGTTVTSTVVVNCNSSGAAITFGSAADATRIGALTLGSGYIHTWTGAVNRTGTGTTHALTIGGRARLSGTFTGTDITVARATEGEIDCLGAGRVTAVTATGNRLVVRRAVDSSGDPVRSWEGDSCTNVRFLGRRVIGSGTTSSAIGIGN